MYVCKTESAFALLKVSAHIYTLSQGGKYGPGGQ